MLIFNVFIIPMRITERESNESFPYSQVYILTVSLLASLREIDGPVRRPLRERKRAREGENENESAEGRYVR